MRHFRRSSANRSWCFKLWCHKTINMSQPRVISTWEMIFVQPFSNNFLTTFSLILVLCFYSLSSFFSLYCFWPIIEEKNKVVMKVVRKRCTNITTLWTLRVFRPSLRVCKRDLRRQPPKWLEDSAMICLKTHKYHYPIFKNLFKFFW